MTLPPVRTSVLVKMSDEQKRPLLHGALCHVYIREREKGRARMWESERARRTKTTAKSFYWRQCSFFVFFGETLVFLAKHYHSQIKKHAFSESRVKSHYQQPWHYFQKCKLFFFFFNVQKRIICRRFAGVSTELCKVHGTYFWENLFLPPVGISILFILFLYFCNYS